MRNGNSVGRLAFLTLRLAVPVYLVSLVLALIPGVVGMAGLVAVAGDRPWRTDLLGPNWLNLLLEVVGAAVYIGGSAGFSAMLLAGLLVPLALLAQLVAYSFLAGGILHRLAVPDASGRPFLAACRRWFWPSLWLSLFGSALVTGVGFLLGVVMALVVRWVSADVAAVLQLVVQAILLGWVELARAIVVREDGETAAHALVRAARAFMLPSILVVWLVLALLPLGLILAALNPPPVEDPSSVMGLLVALGHGQLVAVALAWTKVVRLAVAVSLAERLDRAGVDRSPRSPLRL